MWYYCYTFTKNKFNIYSKYGDQNFFFDYAKLLKAQSLQKLNNPDTFQIA